MLKLTPKFADYTKEYFAYYAAAKDEKRPSTLYTERLAINQWIKHLSPGSCPGPKNCGALWRSTSTVS